MKFRSIVLLAALAAAPVFAQTPPPAGGGGGGPPPEVRAAMDAVQKSCAAESACSGKEGRELFQCLRQNQDKLSKPCQDALSKMPQRPRPAAPPAQ